MRDKNKTYSIKAGEIEKKWYIIDASEQILGRLASKTAMILRGKNKPTFTPHMDMGDHVIIINAENIKVSGQKADKKLYRWHTLFPGGLKERSYAQMSEKNPEKIIENAVKGMLPKTKLGRQQFLNLKVYTGSEHPHAAQKPETVKIGDI